jgi:hypothetical protein
MIRALRNAERQAKADAKEAAKLHVVAQIEEAEDLSRAVQDREKAIGNLLARALAKNPRVDLSSMMKTFAPARFDETQWEMLLHQIERNSPLRHRASWLGYYPVLLNDMSVESWRQIVASMLPTLLMSSALTKEQRLSRNSRQLRILDERKSTGTMQLCSLGNVV